MNKQCISTSTRVFFLLSCQPDILIISISDRACVSREILSVTNNMASFWDQPLRELQPGQPLNKAKCFTAQYHEVPRTEPPRHGRILSKELHLRRWSTESPLGTVRARPTHSASPSRNKA